MKQEQFLDILDRDEAEARWRRAIDAMPRRAEEVALDAALGRVLAEDVRAEVDVPGFDRSNMDGFAVRASDTFGAEEETPVRLRLNPESIPTGVAPRVEVRAGTATSIATGGMLPRGADCVVPVELTDIEDGEVEVRRARVPGAAVSFAGTDIGCGETVLFAGTRLSSRDTGVLAAVGRKRIDVVRRPVVAILSTGDEIVQPGEAMRPGLVYDSNGRILADAVTEIGGEPRFFGAFRDDEAQLREALDRGLAAADLVLLSGGTSKGEGDLNARVVAALDPGIVVHGVALKPGKPICLAASGRQPVVILPGFPTSAVFTFHEFVAPVLREMAGLPRHERQQVGARLAQKVVSERGRLEYLLVGLVRDAAGAFSAWPMGKGSGSVTAFSRADGFVRVARNTEIVDADTPVEVTLIGRDLESADLVVMGSHCVGLDVIAAALAGEGVRVKVLAVGSQGGLVAARREECDAAPLHLLDPETDCYNEPFLDASLRLLPGYERLQGVVTRPDETRETEALLDDPSVRMVNRNRGSGTRILIDQLLGDRRPPGYAYEPRSHFAVGAAVLQGRADWGVTIETVANERGLRFRPLRAEQYDFAIPVDRWQRPAVVSLRRALEKGSAVRRRLEALGFTPRG
ncbi:MAG: molybdopterin biosynthesis protein [Myxococcota bacterium]|nr:molybdopterin biosynthesis protein [Deltaproteobacteria bacterium]MCP4239405.1 molybdopterin biosynthesis protein [bacterium]MDP6075666.1 molybdopterin biosynthesis protein [Myxococcota bacterium]MDP6243038.1 molybdopterin biosynthesis protein [Myxococcota bacterium]MDP7075410.1 molybdopterin biosynthesis protein [Myxococcota bacterium]